MRSARREAATAGGGKADQLAFLGGSGYYGHRMAEDEVIGIVVSNTYPCQAPFGGADRLIGTNPIILGCPTTNPNRPIVIDISTSGVAIGKVQAYRRENKKMPAWLCLSTCSAASCPTRSPVPRFPSWRTCGPRRRALP